MTCRPCATSRSASLSCTPANWSKRRKCDDLLNQPSHPYTQALLAATSDPDGTNATMIKDVPPGEPPNLINPPAAAASTRAAHTGWMVYAM